VRFSLPIIILFKNLERFTEDGTGQGKGMGGARGDCVGHTF